MVIGKLLTDVEIEYQFVTQYLTNLANRKIGYISVQEKISNLILQKL